MGYVEFEALKTFTNEHTDLEQVPFHLRTSVVSSAKAAIIILLSQGCSGDFMK